MVRTGIAHLPLHSGKAPKWLFNRMVALSKSIIEVMLIEYGVNEVMNRLSDPFWFQALSCVLGYDWHSSGTTTVTCGALKEAIDPEKHGIALSGGKGKASLKTLDEILQKSEIFALSSNCIENLQYASRITAKIDSTAIQDTYALYHHMFFFTEKKKWAVIQQGMNVEKKYARRYHWNSDQKYDFLCCPHTGIMSAKKQKQVLDMTAKQSEISQRITVDLINDNPHHIKKLFAQVSLPKSQTLLCEDGFQRNTTSHPQILHMPRTINWQTLREAYEFQPKNYEEFLSLKGIGANTVRALALIADLIHGAPPSWEDPVKYSFTVGGKDGVPFPVDTRAMDETIAIIDKGIQDARIGKKEKLKAFQSLQQFVPT